MNTRCTCVWREFYSGYVALFSKVFDAWHQNGERGCDRVQYDYCTYIRKRKYLEKSMHFKTKFRRIEFYTSYLWPVQVFIHIEKYLCKLNMQCIFLCLFLMCEH